MIVILICIFLLCFYKIKINTGNSFNSGYLESKSTLPMKGLFTLLIFLSHFATYTSMKKPLDLPYAAFKTYLAQAIVAPFLFFSGYGIFVSIKAKKNYVEKMPGNRIWHTLFIFHAALFLFFLTQMIKGRTFSAVYYLQTLISWQSLGNSDWYVFSILSLYLLTYISFAVFGRKNHDAGLIANAALLLVFTLFVKLYKSGYWYNIYFAYWFGMLYARWKDQIDECVMQRSGTWVMSILTVAFSFYILHAYRNNLIAYEACAVLFALFVVLMMMKITLGNPLLVYCGKHLFSLFILQRIPMILLQKTIVAKNDYVYFVVCLILTFILSAVFDKFVPVLWKKFIGDSITKAYAKRFDENREIQIEPENQK